jgi:hypothetical protein
MNKRAVYLNKFGALLTPSQIKAIEAHELPDFKCYKIDSYGPVVCAYFHASRGPGILMLEIGRRGKVFTKDYRS